MPNAWDDLPNGKRIDAVLDHVQAHPEVWAAAWDAASDAIAALVAWDDCGPIVDLPPDAVRLLAASGHQPAILLYPAVVVLNSEV